MNFIGPKIGDFASRTVAGRLVKAATKVPGSQMHPIYSLMISHASADLRGGKRSDFLTIIEETESLFGLTNTCFFNAKNTPDHEIMVGFHLLAARYLLVLWSKNALRSDYVRAELHLALSRRKTVAAYIIGDAPTVPRSIEAVLRTPDELRHQLIGWLNSSDLPEDAYERSIVLLREYEEREFGRSTTPIPHPDAYGIPVGGITTRSWPHGCTRADRIRVAFETKSEFTETFGKRWRVTEFGDNSHGRLVATLQRVG